MKRILVTLMAVAFLATSALVSVAADGPEKVLYETKKGNVTFNHKAHGESLGCEACHEGTPGKIDIDKAAAHGDSCKGCHKKNDGPTKCNACHTK